MLQKLFCRKIIIFAAISALLINNPTKAQLPELRSGIESLMKQYQAKAGISVKLFETGDTLSFYGEERFPMQSVYKFHLALAVYNQINNSKLSPDDSVFISSEDLLPDTWSPIRENYPEGNIYLTLKEIIKYTVSHSDNNGCDILFRWIGGPLKVQQFYQSEGFKDIQIEATEEEMHKDWATQFTNTCTPNSAVTLLERFFNRDILPDPYQQILWKQMVESTTGANRIKKLLPEGTIVAHKTGSSGVNENGITAAANDIGIICLPDGKHLGLAVFITNSKENSQKNDELIAKIARLAYDSFTEYK